MSRVKSFDAFGHKVKVYYRKRLKGGHLGLCDINTHKIYVATHANGEKLSEDAISHNRAHEVTHYWLDSLGYRKLSQDEELVDSLANLIAQYEKTKDG